MGYPSKAFHRNLCCCFFILSAVVVPYVLSVGSQLTLREFYKYSDIFAKEIKKKYSSDAKDQYSDTVTQATDAANNLTVYHRGDPEEPVFISRGQEFSGKPVVVIKRGEDYLLPEDRTFFVVLRQKGGGKEYNVHTAVA
jgi:hypothetical protein